MKKWRKKKPNYIEKILLLLVEVSELHDIISYNLLTMFMMMMTMMMIFFAQHKDTCCSEKSRKCRTLDFKRKKIEIRMKKKLIIWKKWKMHTGRK